MGKFKVSFTTALFVFSFLICVIVAVVFVDRGPRNEYDSFYEEDRAGEYNDRGRNETQASGTGADAWQKRKQGSNPTAATPAPQEASFADLPLDPHLVGAAQAVPSVGATPAAAQPTANPHQGKSPEQIARELMKRGGVTMPSQATPAIPSMAVPGGIATPAQQSAAVATPQAAVPQTNTYLPLQSNLNSSGIGSATSPYGSPGGFGSPVGTNIGSSLPPSLGNSTSNMGSEWDAVTARQNPTGMIGVQGSKSASDAGMMISRGKSEVSEPPLGFEPSITTDGPAQGFGASATPGPGGAQAPILFPPSGTPEGGNKWDLPPAPTLRPPPIQDPDQRRSDADGPDSGTETPDSTNPDGSSGQALAVSSVDGTATVETATPDAIAARVNEQELTEDKAARLAQVKASIDEESITPENRQEKITEAVRDWTSVMAAAEQARKQELSLSTTEVDKYAAMRPDFDIDAWKKNMAQVGFTKADIEKHLEAIALSEKFLEKELADKYPAEELKKVYEKTPKEFYKPRQVLVRELFKAKPEDEKQNQAVEKEMNRLQRQAAGGADFGLLARTISQAKSKAKGGDLGWLTPDEEKKSNPKLVEAVAELKPGQVSSVIETDEGYWIYKLVEEKEARDSFDASKELVLEKLKEDLREETLADARKEADVELAPKKEIKVAEAEAKDDKADSKDKNPKADKSSNSTPVEVATPQRPIQQAAASGQLLYAPGARVEQREGGAPAPPVQPGGQPPVQQRIAASDDSAGNRSYSPGQTMTIGDDRRQSAAQPTATSQNYAAPLSVGAVATPDTTLTPEQQALQLRALQARTQQEEQARNAEIEAQVQAARAQAARQAQQAQQAQLQNPEAPMDASQMQPGQAQWLNVDDGTAAPAQAATSAANDQPVATISNGWQVTKREIERPTPRQAQANANAARQANGSSRPDDGPSSIPPGFEGSSPNPGAGSPAVPSPAQPQPQAEPEREGGFFGGVKNLFSRNR